MELGERICQARKEAGLSQRALCGEEITRNMLSQIEHGTAQPSIATLRYLAGRLGKPISFFLDEEGSASPNSRTMAAVRKAFADEDYGACLEAMRDFAGPDPEQDMLKGLLECLALQGVAAQAIREGKDIYARQCLERAAALETDYPWLPELRLRRGRLLAQLPGELPEEVLPQLDGDLRMLAEQALAGEGFTRAAALLDACLNREDSRWKLLRGRAALGMEEYGTAARHLQQAEEANPQEAVPLLEICFRELGDFKMAYHYATKQRM